jgi:hypothetical protein
MTSDKQNIETKNCCSEKAKYFYIINTRKCGKHHRQQKCNKLKMKVQYRPMK